MSIYQIISVILSIIIFVMILLIALITNLLRESSKKDAPYSFSRFQLWIWTLVICPAFILNWGFCNLELPTINDTSLILLGISSGLAISSNIIANALFNNPPMKMHPVKKELLKMELKQDGISKNFWSDILSDGTGQFSITRLQNLVFTLVYLVIYVTLFIRYDKVYPDFDLTAFTLMGISSGGYLFGKGLNG
jgi:hypothetical protein